MLLRRTDIIVGDNLISVRRMWAIDFHMKRKRHSNLDLCFSKNFISKMGTFFCCGSRLGFRSMPLQPRQ